MSIYSIVSWLVKMPLKIRTGLLFFVVVCACQLLLAAVNPAYAALDFGNPRFQALWNYSDLAVASGQGAGRGYTWGPSSLGSLQENYFEAPCGTRQVQYFDKSRMELQIAPDTTYVTNGLLTVELVSGQRQDGDHFPVYQKPSQTQVVGDDNTYGNAIAPTYASFVGVTTFIYGLHTAPDMVGKNVNQAIDRDGKVTTLDTPPVAAILGRFEPAIGHNIPQIFSQFENQSGQIWNGQEYVPGQIYTDNPTANVFGYPISEAYWTKAVVANVLRDVLVQLFERRVLTYTPANPDPFKVEMGNIGQHYYNWRYNAIKNAPQTTRLSTLGIYEANPKHLLKTATGIVVDRQYNVFVADRDGQQVSKIDSNGQIRNVIGSLGSGNGQFNNPQGVAIDSQCNLYVTDWNNHRVQKFDAAGKFVTKWGSPGTGNSQFGIASGIAVDSHNNVYVADEANNNVQKFDSNGKFLTSWGGKGSGDGQFNFPHCVAVDSQDNIYVTDTANNRVQKFDRDGHFLAKFGDSGQFNFPEALTTDMQGNFYVGNGGYVQKFDSNGKLLAKYNSDFNGLSKFWYPLSLAVDSQNNLYVTDLFTFGGVSRSIIYKYKQIT